MARGWRIAVPGAADVMAGKPACSSRARIASAPGARQPMRGQRVALGIGTGADMADRLREQEAVSGDRGEKAVQRGNRRPSSAAPPTGTARRGRSPRRSCRRAPPWAGVLGKEGKPARGERRRGATRREAGAEQQPQRSLSRPRIHGTAPPLPVSGGTIGDVLVAFRLTSQPQTRTNEKPARGAGFASATRPDGGLLDLGFLELDVLAHLRIVLAQATASRWSSGDSSWWCRRTRCPRCSRA